MRRASLAFALVALATLTLGARPANATVDAVLRYTVPYQHLSTDDVCLMRLPVLARFGIPAAALTEASLTATRVLQQFPSRHYANVNLAAPGKKLVHTYVSDRITTNGVWEYAMKLDVTRLATAGGTSIAGRTRTIRTAKLALIAIAKNLEDASQGSYQLTLTFTGLPSQAGLPGTELHATTLDAYSVDHPLLNAYISELIDVEGSCPQWE
jgi:hypothetical protein